MCHLDSGNLEELHRIEMRVGAHAGGAIVEFRAGLLDVRNQFLERGGGDARVDHPQVG
jgi:hypothetical protein